MFKRSSFFVAMLAVGFFVLVESSSVNAQGGVFLGARNVSDRGERDVIGVGAGKGEFKRLQFRVGQRAVDFKKVVVHFVNGGEEEIDLRDRIPAGGQSRWVDLPGGSRKIVKIELWYDAATVRRGVRSQISAYGAR